MVRGIIRKAFCNEVRLSDKSILTMTVSAYPPKTGRKTLTALFAFSTPLYGAGLAKRFFIERVSKGLSSVLT